MAPTEDPSGRSAHPASRRAARVRLVVMDVDATLTDGRIVIGADRELAKHFSVRDGFGLGLLARAGIERAIITGRRSDIVLHRAAELGIRHVHQGATDKRAALATLCAGLGIGLADTAFIGDDWPDLGAMRASGLAAAPCDAEPEVLAAAHWVSQRPAGHGAVRDLARFVLGAQRRLDALLRDYDGGAG